MDKKISMILFSVLIMIQVKVFAVYPVVIKISSRSSSAVASPITFYYQRTVKDSLHIVRGFQYKADVPEVLSSGRKRTVMLPSTNFQIGIGIQRATVLRCYYFQPTAKWGGTITVTAYGIASPSVKASSGIKTAPYKNYSFHYKNCPFNPWFQ